MAHKGAMTTHPIGPILLFSGCWLWYISITFFATFSMSYKFLSTSHLEGTQSTCILIKVMPLLSYLTFHDSRFMGENIINCLLWFANNALQYLWVYNINKQVVLTNKKVPTNRFQTWIFLVQMKELCGCGS